MKSSLVLHNDANGMPVMIALQMLNEVAQQRYLVLAMCAEHITLDEDHMHSDTS
jgi:hypothetical protein